VQISGPVATQLLLPWQAFSDMELWLWSRPLVKPQV